MGMYIEPLIFNAYLFVPDWLSVTTPKRTWISQQMGAEMNPVFNFVCLHVL